MPTKTWNVGRSMLFMVVALVSAILVDQMVGCMSAAAQQSIASAAALPATADDLIRQMAGSAGVIFVGQVVAVRHPAGSAGSPLAAAEGAVEIDFHVEQVVRGPQSGSTYTLREWSGLWVGGSSRYRIGQRLLMLLRTPDTSGFTSPVHGAEGAIPLRGAGAAPGPDDSSSTAAQWMVDIRWLKAQTLRSQVQIVVPSHGTIPVRGGRSPRSELDGMHFEEPNPSLVRAFPGPWLEPAETVAHVEPLEHVLSLCSIQAEP